MSKVRNLLIVINVKPSSFPVDVRSNSGLLLETMLGCSECYNMGMADSTNRASNRNFNRELVIKWGISRVVRVVS